MRSAYLTIDDSASDRMDDLVSYLSGKGIPALFYCRGDMLDKNPDAAIRAIKKGFTLANHTYSHQRSSEKDFEWLVADIEKCEGVLDELHEKAGVKAKGKYFRFPHLDRGTGGWVVDFDSYTGDNKEAVMAAFAQGLNNALVKPDASALDKKQKLQNYLKDAGYTQPFDKVTHPWFNTGEIAAAYDSLFTFSNCDWMVTERHKGQWPYKSVEDLKQKARQDRWLSQEGSVNVVLAHDQSEIVDVTIALIDDLAEKGLIFKDLP